MCLAGDPEEEEEAGPGLSQAGEAARAKLLRKTQARCALQPERPLCPEPVRAAGQDAEVWDCGGAPWAGHLSTDGGHGQVPAQLCLDACAAGCRGDVESTESTG